MLAVRDDHAGRPYALIERLAEVDSVIVPFISMKSGQFASTWLRLYLGPSRSRWVEKQWSKKCGHALSPVPLESAFSQWCDAPRPPQDHDGCWIGRAPIIGRTSLLVGPPRTP